MLKQKNYKNLVLLVLTFTLVSLNGNAKERRIPKPVEPLQIKTSLLYNDNINPTIEADEDSGGFGGLFSAYGFYSNDGEGFQYALNYSGEFARYRVQDDVVVNTQEYDFAKGSVSLHTDYFMSDIWELETDFSYSKEAEPLGTSISRLQKNVGQPDELAHSYAGVTLVYGKQNYNRNYFLTLDYNDFTYDDNNDYSKLFDYRHITARGGVKFRRNSATTFLANFQFIDEEYDSDLRADNVIYTVLGGVEWTATGHSYSQFLIGGFYRDIEGFDPSTSLAWNVRYEYSHRDDMNFRFDTVRTTVAAFDVVAIDTLQTDYTFLAEYFYSEQWEHFAKFQFIDSSFREGNRKRTMDEIYLSVGTKLHVNNHTEMTFELIRADVELSDGSVDYEQNEAKLSWLYAF